MDAFSSVALALEKLRELGAACGNQVGDLMKQTGDHMVVIGGMWQECATREG